MFVKLLLSEVYFLLPLCLLKYNDNKNNNYKTKGSITKKEKKYGGIDFGSRRVTKHRRHCMDTDIHSISHDYDPSRVSIILWRYE